jgi:putative peptide zinc metalloprotease protein
VQGVDHAIQEPLNAVLRLRSDLRFARHEFEEEPCYVVEDPFRAKFYRVGIAEHTFISLLDGHRTIRDAIGLAAVRLRELAFTENEALSICRWLLEMQLAESRHAVDHRRLLKKADERRGWLAKLLNPLSIRVPLFNPTAALIAIEPWLAWTLGRRFFIVWLVCGLYAMALAVADWHRLVAGTLVLLDRQHWWMLIAGWLALKLFHETYHGLVCRKYGGTVTEAGICLLFFAPVPYVEVSSSWRFASKWHRIATAAAGMYIELFAAALAIILWANAGDGALKQVALSVAAMASIGTLVVNANPLMRFDGYYILSDLLEVPNLNPHGRRWRDTVVERLLGCTPSPLGLSPRTTKIVIIYTVAAFVWRSLVWCALLLAILVFLGRLHASAAIAGAVLIVGMAGYRTCRWFARLVGKHPMLSRPRLAVAGCVAANLVMMFCYWLVGPSIIRAPAIVDYHPLVSVRSASPGFIRELRVTDGQSVKAGEVVAVLENRELALELRIAELRVEQSVARCRMLRQAGEVAKEQAEMAEQEGLRKKRKSIAEQIDSLLIRAPAGGRTIGRHLDAWVGQYVATGTELFLIGDERAKELVVALPQDDVELFQRHGAAPVEVRFASQGISPIQTAIETIEPRATSQPPHEALASNIGGPLTVRIVEEEDNRNAPRTHELLDPCFRASVRLTPQQSKPLRAGQLAWVEFKSDEQSWARRMHTLVERWFDQQLRRNEA